MSVNVDLKTLQSLNPGGLEGIKPSKPSGIGGVGPSFEETLKGLGQNPVPTAKTSGTQNADAFGGGVKFSNHAVERMQSRGISFNQTDLQRLGDAINRASAKGSKDTLVLMNDSALIVSVKNKTVVTVMDKNALKENVFTNIDSTIVM
jgi:flagellar operon protein